VPMGKMLRWLALWIVAILVVGVIVVKLLKLVVGMWLYVVVGAAVVGGGYYLYRKAARAVGGGARSAADGRAGHVSVPVLAAVAGRVRHPPPAKMRQRCRCARRTRVGTVSLWGIRMAAGVAFSTPWAPGHVCSSGARPNSVSCATCSSAPTPARRPRCSSAARPVSARTRLVEEFRTYARGEGAEVLYGACLELGEEGLPFAPFAAALRDLLRRAGPGVFAGHEQEFAGCCPSSVRSGRRASPTPAAAISSTSWAHSSPGSPRSAR
jgi:hypothetical protein